MDSSLPHGLYIVATPIGNLGDLSPRAADTLRHADAIAVEDSRVTAKLLHHIGIKKPMIPYHDHSDERTRDRLLGMMTHQAVALVSDAGTPLISDPGYKLVRAAREAGLHVSAVPGPCAATTALSMAGLPTDRFLFAGFLPNKAKARADAIAEIAGLRASLVFYESGPRLGATLAALADGLGARGAAVLREISKRFEQCVNGDLVELAARYREETPRGEIVIVVGPPESDNAPSADAADLDALLIAALVDLPPARAAKTVAKTTGLDRADVYARAMALKAGA